MRLLPQPRQEEQSKENMVSSQYEYYYITENRTTIKGSVGCHSWGSSRDSHSRTDQAIWIEDRMNTGLPTIQQFSPHV